MKRSHNWLLSVAAFIIAAVFIFSGFVKLIDPMGLQYKLDDYFKAFALPSFQSASLFFSIMLSSTELVLGLCLLFRIAKRPASVLIFVFMTFFTVLTLILALTNPVSDCGCFGDAIKLTNWQTFFKNLFFWPISWFVVSEMRKEKGQMARNNHGLWVLLFYGLAVSIGIYCYHHLPLLDFLPYKKGVNIAQKIGTTQGVSYDEYKTVLYYKKWGRVKAFSPDSIPWRDTTWKFVDSKTELIKRGNAPDIDNLTMINPATGEDQLHRILESEYAFLIIAPYLKKSDFSNMDHLNRLASVLSQNKAVVVALTGDTRQEIEAFRKQYNPGFEILSTDAVTLKTMIRAYPGYMMLHKGTIMAKWTSSNLPDAEEMELSVHDFCAPALAQDQATDTRRTLVLSIAALLLLGCLIRLSLGRARRR